MKQLKYRHRHIQVSISERSMLKETALNKPFKELTRDDLQDWVAPFLWEYVRGLSVLNRDGEIDIEESQQFAQLPWKEKKKISLSDLLRIIKS